MPAYIRASPTRVTSPVDICDSTTEGTRLVLQQSYGIIPDVAMGAHMSASRPVAAGTAHLHADELRSGVVLKKILVMLVLQ